MFQAHRALAASNTVAHLFAQVIRHILSPHLQPFSRRTLDVVYTTLQMKLSMLALCIMAASLAVSSVLADFQYGLPWGGDSRWAASIAKKSSSWYHHWENGLVHELGHLEYVPTFWGPTKWSQWNKRKHEMNHLHIEHLLAFNEPDVKGQANIDPDTAVGLFMQELQPYARKGIKVSSPQMVWDLDWLSKFMNKCHEAGCSISFIALHWYGGPRDIEALKKWVRSVHDKFKMPIWITEYGLNAKSNPSDDDTIGFLAESLEWMSTQPYIHRVAWNGCYDVGSKPDSFISAKNAYFKDGSGALRAIAHAWFSGKGNILMSNPNFKIVNNTRNSADDSLSRHKAHRKRFLL